MTFLSQNGAVFWITPGGSYELSLGEIETLLGIFDRAHDVKLWLALDEAAQAAGYPPSVSSLRTIKGFVPEPAIDGRGAQSPRSLAAQHFGGKSAA